MGKIDAAAIQQSLSDASASSLDLLEVFSEIDSTNSYLLRQRPPLPGRHRIAIAGHQTAGRGRHDREWISAQCGSLCLSIAHTFTETPDNLPGLTLASGYDRLVLATGSALHSPPIPGIAEHSWNIDTYDAALAFDRHLRALTANPKTPGNDTFVIIGGGFTGIELATEMRSRIAEHGGEEAAAAARVILVYRSDVIGRNLGDNQRSFI